MTAIEATACELTPEMLDLYEHEKVIEQGLASFIDVGCALIAIKAGRKYVHAGYATFEDYCQQRWSIGRNYGHRLVVAAAVAEGLMLPIGNTVTPAPQTESQVRPLTALKSPDDQRAAWADAVDAADGGQPTAAEVKQAVEKRLPPKPPHPAKFSDKILDKIAEHLPTEGVVLDPFAGTGRIHELATAERRTVGIEIEQEWAETHADTIHADALDALSDMAEALGDLTIVHVPYEATAGA